jgi:hypothetical protein
MTSPDPTAPDETSAPYEVGYGKPPRHTQFRKGQSGNPGGRPRRPPTGRLDNLVLSEVYRQVFEKVHDGGPLEPMPVIRSVLRSQLDLARNGNVRAQRDVLKMVRDIERARIENGYAAGEPDDDDLDDDVADGDLDDDVADGDVDDGGAGGGAAGNGGVDDNGVPEGDGEPARQQDGTGMNGDGRWEESDRTAPPPDAGTPQPENAAASPESGGQCPERRRPAAVCAGTSPGVRDPHAAPRRRDAAAPRKRARRSQGPTRTGLGKTGLGKTGLGKTGLGKTGIGKTGIGKTGLGKTGIGKTGIGSPAQATGGSDTRAPALRDRRKN